MYSVALEKVFPMMCLNYPLPPPHTHTHIQSVTVPLQGFLNALVYGWTREDFIHVMKYNNKKIAGGEQNMETATPTHQHFQRELEESVDYGDTMYFTDKEVNMVKQMSGDKRGGSLRRKPGKVGYVNQIQASLIRTETGFSDSEYEDR